jgi:glycine betaine/choline ABC-type transport system substrate-binding protein
MDLGLLYRALDAGEADLVAGNSTDAALSRPEFLVLEDDRKFFPPYEACLAVREATLTRVAGLRGALDGLANRISTAAMRTANYQLTVERKNVAEIAANLLRP